MTIDLGHPRFVLHAGRTFSFASIAAGRISSQSVAVSSSIKFPRLTPSINVASN